MFFFQYCQNLLSYQLAKTSKLDGRFPLLAVLTLYFLPILLKSTFFTRFTASWYTSLWVYPFVPKLLPPFADLRVITSGAECIRQGYDVLLTNPCDPWNRPMNYPRLWGVPAAWGLDQSHTIFLGILLGLLFFTAVFISIGRLNYLESLIYGLVIVSPSVMLSVERGNNDLIVFTIIALSLLAISKNHLPWRSWGYFLILIAAILKLYPIFALTSCLRERRRVFGFIIISISSAFLLYVLANYESLKLVRKATPQATHFSYGCKVIFDMLFSEPDLWLNPSIEPGVANSIYSLKTPGIILSVVIVIFLAYRLAKNGKDYLQQNPLATSHIDAFRIGASIYAGTFLIGNNFDYRLIFLLFTLPQLLEWLKQKSFLTLSSGLSLTGIILSFWLSSNTLSYLYLDELLNWLLFLFYTYALFLTLPPWLVTYLYFQPQFLAGNR